MIKKEKIGFFTKLRYKLFRIPMADKDTFRLKYFPVERRIVMADPSEPLSWFEMEAYPNVIISYFEQVHHQDEDININVLQMWDDDPTQIPEKYLWLFALANQDKWEAKRSQEK